MHVQLGMRRQEGCCGGWVAAHHKQYHSLLHMRGVRCRSTHTDAQKVHLQWL